MNPEEDTSSTKTACPSGPIAHVLILPDDAQPVHLELSNWDEIDDFLTRDHDEYPDQRKMFILNGLHARLALELAVRMDVDPGFFDCHIYRTRYIPPREKDEHQRTQSQSQSGNAKGGPVEKMAFFQIDYPQVQELCIPEAMPASRSSEITLQESGWMADENMLCVSPDSRKAYVLDGTLYRWDGMLVGTFGYWRRMSWWSSEREKTSIMIIDGPLEALLPPHISPATIGKQAFRNNIKRHTGTATDALDNLYSRWRERRRPQSFLEKFLRDGTPSTVYEVATEVALQQWTLLLAAVQMDRGPNQASAILEITSQRIENNILDCTRVQGQTHVHALKWQELSKLLPSRRDSAYLQTVTAFHDKLQRIERKLPPPTPGSQNDRLALAVKEDRRALNRLSYMGGVLLPFSIVAGVFSMAGEFTAGGSLFFVYWVLVVPGVVVALLAVYADTVRVRRVNRVVREGRKMPAWVGRLLRRYRSDGDEEASETSSASEESAAAAAPVRQTAGEVVPVRQGFFPAVGGRRLPMGVVAPGGMPGRRMNVPWPTGVLVDEARNEDTEELGWWRALRTLVGYEPDWANVREDGR